MKLRVIDFINMATKLRHTLHASTSHTLAMPS